MAFGRAASYTLYTEYFEKKYVSNICSWGFIFHVFVVLTVIILPFVLTFSTGTFWAKHDVYYQQPTVTYKNKLYSQFQFMNFDTNQKTVYSFSTVRAVRDQAQNLLNPPTIKSSHQDFNRDGIPERWNITMRLRKPNAQSILTGADLLIDFDYFTQDVINMKMESLAIVNLDIPAQQGSPVRSIKTIGTLDLKQDYPLRVKRDQRTLYNDDLFSYLEYESYESFINRYNYNRNETTQYNYETHIMRGTLDQNYIDINVIINIPTHQPIIYIPDVWEVLKFAWIQYYSLLFLVYVFLYRLFYGFVIKNKVFDSIEVTSVNVKAISDSIK